MEKLKVVFCSLIAALLSSCGGGSSGGVMEDSMKIKTECDYVNVTYDILNEMGNQLAVTCKREGIAMTRPHMLKRLFNVVEIYEAMSIDEQENFKNNGVLSNLLDAERRYHIKKLRDWSKRDLKNCPNFNKVANLGNNIRYDKILPRDYSTKLKFISAFPTFPKDVLEHYSYLFDPEPEEDILDEEAKKMKAEMEHAEEELREKELKEQELNQKEKDLKPTIKKSNQPKVEQQTNKKYIAIIQDPDGYTNVRNGMSTNAKIIDRLFEGEHFEVFPSSDNNWWVVYTQSNVKGYVHKSRIKIIN